MYVGGPPGYWTFPISDERGPFILLESRILLFSKTTLCLWSVSSFKIIIKKSKGYRGNFLIFFKAFIYVDLYGAWRSIRRAQQKKIKKKSGHWGGMELLQ